MLPMSMTDGVFTDSACTICGCVCDDLRLTVRDNRIVQAERACQLAEPWFLAQESRHPPVARIGGAAVSLTAAVQRAADILRTCRSPLIYGLSRSSTAGQRAAVRLADLAGATIDTTASRCHAPSIMALQQVGESTCSLGEIKNRADLIVFWGSNPLASHPRHFERYSVEAAGRLTPQGRRDRHVVVVDVKPTATTELADTFLRIEPGRDFELIWTLRCLLRGLLDLPAETRLTALVDLVQRLKACRYGIVFFGLGLTRNGVGHANVEALLRLVTDLNQFTRFSARRMRIPGDVAGADSVLCWQTGFPFSVNLARGYPRYNPGEYSANELLERGEVDACLLVGSEGLGGLSPAATERLRQLPLIVLDYPTVDCQLPPTVAFTTAVYGVHLPGTAYRMDEVPIPLRAMLTSDYPSDATVLREITDQLAANRPPSGT